MSAENRKSQLSAPLRFKGSRFRVQGSGFQRFRLGLDCHRHKLWPNVARHRRAVIRVLRHHICLFLLLFNLLYETT
jgi:hypothetical protein